MNDQVNNGKGFLKDKLGSYQVDPPEKVWDSISSALGGRSRRGMIILTLSAAATIALAVALGITFFGPDQPSESITQTSTESVSEPDPGADPRTPESLTKIAEADPEPQPEVARETLEQRVIRTMKEIEGESMGESVAQVADTERSPEPVPDLGDEEAAEQFSDRVLEEASEEISGQDEEHSQQPPVQEELSDEPVAEPVDQLTSEDELLLDQIPGFEEEQKRDPRWMIGAALSPLYSYRDAEASALGGSTDHESGLISYAAGINVAYRPLARLALESGVFFNKMGISIGSPGIQLANRSYDFAPLGEKVLSSNVMAISNSVGNIVTKSGDIYVNSYKLNAENAGNSVTDELNTEVYADQGIRQHLDYLEVPFNIRYTIIDRGIELQVVGGMSTNLLVNSFVTMETSTGQSDIGYLTNIRSVNYSGNAGMGMIYHIQEHFSLRLEPRFRYFLNSINDASLPSTRPYAFGIFTGLSYRF
jgi:hypothetical protein